ncbi:MAG: phosphoesterase [Hydrogenothermaceae bacterium]|nr:phosphoesterase [Hydrogenothermaceae bacterium]
MIFFILLYVNFSPVRVVKLNSVEAKDSKETKPSFHVYKVVAHVHTQFSFDSLGKPSDIKKAMEENRIDFVFVTDHNNDEYRFFEDEKIFAGVEKNTQEGRLLLLANQIPVISHPHNFEFEHYRWKGEFKQDHLYEFIDPKDVIVWNKFKTSLALLKNILIYPFTRDITYKWNCLIPIGEWRKLYFDRAKDLKIVGGLDLHVKFVYQEKTHGVLIPSYRAGFRWLVNMVYCKETLSSKDDVLNSLKSGNLYLSINQNMVDIWVKDDEGYKILGEKVKSGGRMFVILSNKKRVSKVFKDNHEILTTDRREFQLELSEKGKYWLEVYEYDFKIFNLFFGFRPVIITNSFTVG